MHLNLNLLSSNIIVELISKHVSVNLKVTQYTVTTEHLKENPGLIEKKKFMLPFKKSALQLQQTFCLYIKVGCFV